MQNLGWTESQGSEARSRGTSKSRKKGVKKSSSKRNSSRASRKLSKGRTSAQDNLDNIDKPQIFDVV